MSNEFDKYYEATEPGYRERAIGWATAIGLQDVDGLKPSKYLISTAKRNIEGEITANEARQLVDAYYEVKEGHDIPENFESPIHFTTEKAEAVFAGHGKGLWKRDLRENKPFECQILSPTLRSG